MNRRVRYFPIFAWEMSLIALISNLVGQGSTRFCSESLESGTAEEEELVGLRSFHFYAWVNFLGIQNK